MKLHFGLENNYYRLRYEYKKKIIKTVYYLSSLTLKFSKLCDRDTLEFSISIIDFFI